MVPRRKLLGDLLELKELPGFGRSPTLASSSAAVWREPSYKLNTAETNLSVPGSASIPPNPLKRMKSVDADASAVEPQRKYRREMGSCARSECALTGLAAIPVGEELFEGSCSAAEIPSGRRCFRPLWSLIGTFKTELHSLVDLDLHNDILKWYQHTPSGGLQNIRVPLASITNVRVSSTRTSDAGTEYWVIVRTRTKPSQVVFGLRRLGEARQMRLALKSTDAA